MKNKIVKGILLMLGVIFAALQDGNVVWAATIITTVCVGGGYFIKNLFLESISSDGVFDWRDVLSAVLLAIFAAVGESVTALVIDGAIDWSLLVKTIMTVVTTYFTATFFPNAKQAKTN